MALLTRLADLLWNPWLLALFLITGGYYSIRTGFFQIFGVKTWWKSSIGSLFHGSKKSSRRGITQFQALSTALAATIGTGSIAGVATAIFYGGPGAVFWMWVSALLGMMTGCAEKTLAVRYRERSPDGGWQGGPMYYMEHGLGWKPLAVLFSLFCIAETLVGGNLVQANSISTALEASFGWNPLIVGLVIAALTGAVVLGGIGRIGKVSERLVPCMAILFLLGGLIVLFCHISALPGVLRDIMTQAFSPKAACGGYGAAAALRYGVARGVFTNEAGLGTSAMAHAAADVEEPAQQGMWGILEVFVATLVICTMTALVILTSGVYDPAAALNAISSGTVENSMLGAPLSAAAFSTVFGRFGGIFVAVCLILFAFTSLLGASYYGEQCLAYLTGSRRYVPLYRLFFLGMIVLGSVGDLSATWLLVDLSNGLMAIPNLIALLLLSKEAVALINHYQLSPLLK
ncbi:MAG: alanine/glycine:cation symporter family protein [Oscillospiraceae bacterium]